MARKMKRFMVAGIAVMVSMATVGNAQNTPVPAAPETSSADAPAWKEYKKLLENYYFLDKQKAGHIECSVSVPQLQDLIDARRQKYVDKLIIDETLHDFSVTYDRTKGLSFNSPHQNTRIRPDAQLSDRVRAENVLKKTDKDFDEAVSNLEDSISQIIMYMISPAPQNDLTLKKDGDVTVVSFDDVIKDYHAKVIYSGTTQQITVSSPNASGTSTLDFQLFNGKLALAHAVGGNDTRFHNTYSISYQDLGSAVFPKQILADGTDGTQQGKPWHNEIDFKDCKTSDVSP